MSLKVTGINQALEDASTRFEDVSVNQLKVSKQDGTLILTIDSDGTVIIADTAAGVKVGANKVLGARGAAIADEATADADATFGQPEADLVNSMKAKLNLVLARMRAHGLIA